MSDFKRNSTITFLTQIFSTILAFIPSIILARVLGSEGKGIYSITILIPMLMMKLGTFGLESSNIYYTGKDKSKISTITNNSILFSLIISIFLWGILILLLKFSGLSNYIIQNKINMYYLWGVVLILPFGLLFQLLSGVLLGREEFIKYNSIRTLRIILQTILVCSLLILFKLDLLGAIVSYAFSTMIPAILLLFYLLRLKEYHVKIDIGFFTQSMRYSSKVYFGNIAQFLNYRFDIFLVAYYLSPSAVGIYSISVLIAERLWMIPSSLATVLFPRISSCNKNEADILTPKVIRFTFYIVFLVAILVVLLGYPTINILFGNEFISSFIPLLILLPGIIAISIAKVVSSYLAGRGKPQFAMQASLISFVINIGLNVLLIPRIGLSGAAVASTIAYLFSTIILIIAYIKISSSSIREIFYWKKTDWILFENLYTKLRGSLK